MGKIMKFYLLASIILASTAIYPQENPNQPESRFTHVTKAWLYSLLTAGAVVATGCAGWAYYFHRNSKESLDQAPSSQQFIKQPPFGNEEYLSNKTLAYLVASGATVAYTGLKSVEHLNKARLTPSARIDRGIEALKHILKGGYWAGATVGCYAVSKEFEKLITNTHTPPEFFARQFDTPEQAAQSYNRRVKALSIAGFLGVSAGAGFCVYKTIKEAEFSLRATPSGASVTVQL
jgi:hypothetical protein